MDPRLHAVAPEASQRAFTLGQILNPYDAHYRRPFAFCFFLSPLHHGRRLRFGCRRHRSDDGDTSGLPRFPRCPIRPAGQTMGLGTFYPPRVRREQAEVNDPQLQTRCRFGPSSPVSRETRVSWIIVTTVQANVHLCFPYPLPRHPLTVLLDVSPTITDVLRAVRRGMFSRSSAHPDCSGCTNGQGHSVPGMVSIYGNKAP